MTTDGDPPQEHAAVVVTHVGLAVADLERSERFYTEVFGFRRVHEIRPPDEVTGKLLQVELPVGLTARYLGLGTFVLELLHFDRDDNDPERARPFTEPGLTHLSVTVDDLPGRLALVTEHGGTVLGDTDVGVAVLVRDPDGQVVELIQARR